MKEGKDMSVMYPINESDDNLIVDKELLDHWNSVSDNLVSMVNHLDTCDDWELKSLSKIIRMALDNDQLVISDKYPVHCNKVIKCRRAIPVGYLKTCGYDYTIMDGLYLVHGMLMIPKCVMKDITGSYKGKPIYDTSSLPDGYIYGTLQQDNYGVGYALQRSALTGYLGYSSAYKFFDIGDYPEYYYTSGNSFNK